MSKKDNTKLAQVFHFDLYGKRQEKYDFLQNNSLQSIDWKELDCTDENYFFVPKDFSLKEEYEEGFKVDELFLISASGIKTQRDDASIKFTQKECDEIKNDFLTFTNDELVKKYGFKDVRDWTINEARKDLQNNKIIVNQITYRPFDTRYMNYTGKTKGVQGYPRLDIMKHFVGRENIGLITCRQQSTFDFQHIFVTKLISDMCSVSSQTKETGYVFPLYLYPETHGQQSITEEIERVPNLNKEIVAKITRGLNPLSKEIEPIDILDYIYAVLHSPSYRERYKEFLKIDFPRVPYPDYTEKFWKLIELGGKLRRLHLLDDAEINKGINLLATYPIDGNNEVDKPQFVVEAHCNAFVPNGRVYINATQYFDNVPAEAWNFYIGGYQPAQKWLKDCKGRTLNFEDIRHYRKIICVLKATGDIMQEVDTIMEG